jgi:hypothetical protein
MLSANTVAQKAGGSVMPPLSPTQGCAAGAAVLRVLCGRWRGAQQQYSEHTNGNRSEHRPTPEEKCISLHVHRVSR